MRFPESKLGRMKVHEAATSAWRLNGPVQNPGLTLLIWRRQVRRLIIISAVLVH